MQLIWSCMNCVSGTEIVCEQLAADSGSTDVWQWQVSWAVTMICALAVTTSNQHTHCIAVLLKNSFTLMTTHTHRTHTRTAVLCYWKQLHSHDHRHTHTHTAHQSFPGKPVSQLSLGNTCKGFWSLTGRMPLLMLTSRNTHWVQLCDAFLMGRGVTALCVGCSTSDVIWHRRS